MKEGVIVAAVFLLYLSSGLLTGNYIYHRSASQCDKYRELEDESRRALAYMLCEDARGLQAFGAGLAWPLYWADQAAKAVTAP
jgi:hypothetical protein